LEAQNAGVPIVASIEASVPEVAGEGALLVNPKNPSAIAEAAYKLISGEELKNDIIKRGYENISQFSWEKCSLEISELLKD